MTCVPGACSASSAKATSAVSAECPLPGDGDVPARVPGADGRVVEVRHAVGDPVGARSRSPSAGSPSPPSGFGRAQVPRGVDHRARGEPLLAAVAVRTCTVERLAVPARVHHAVPAPAGDADDPGAVAAPGSPSASASGCRYRSAHSAPVGYAVRVRRRASRSAASSFSAAGSTSSRPAARTAARGATRAHRGAGRRPRLQHQRLQPALQQVRGGGQPDRSGADDDHRQLVGLAITASIDRSFDRYGTRLYRRASIDATIDSTSILCA